MEIYTILDIFSRLCSSDIVIIIKYSTIDLTSRRRSIQFRCYFLIFISMSKGLWGLVGSAVLTACGGGSNTPCPPTFGADASKTLTVTVGTQAANCLALAKAANADPDKYTVTGLPT